MKDRLLQLLTSENMTALKFAEIMEIRPSNVSHILSGRNNPNFDFIARLLRRFPELNPDWVLNGVGAMYREGFKHDFEAMGDENVASKMGVDVVSELFSEEEITFPEIEIANPAPRKGAMSITAQSQASPVQRTDTPITNIPEPQIQHPVAPTTEQAKKDVAEKTTSALQKIMVIYADNTFEILEPRSR